MEPPSARMQRSRQKAVWEKTGGIVLADDSGLVIDYLNGEPGVIQRGI